MPGLNLITRKSRFYLFFQVALLALIGFTILRTALMIKVWQCLDHTFFENLYIFGMGLTYDMAFLSYCLVPFVLLFFFVPEKWLDTKIFKGITQLTIFATLCALFFIFVAEWLFWDEFGARFNFISVDYLVYRREVTDNVIQSYPLYSILFSIFAATGIVFLAVKKYFLTSKDVSETFVERLKNAALTLLIPATAALFINQSQHTLSDNNYANELASNGPYQLFSAFRINSLDYKQFYALGDDEFLSEKLKKEVHAGNSHFETQDLYNISRKIEADTGEKNLNVILISVESLSAKYLTRFGSKENITPFMDELLTHGMLFTNFYATGTRTTRGLEAITLSIPPTPGRSVVKRPDNSNMYSFGKVFKEHGYDVSFIYGGRGYFDNMNTFFSGNGYEIIDQTDLNKNEISFENAWGVADEDIYKKALKEADIRYNSGRPFFFHIMTTSNHRPYTYPEGKIEIPSGTNRAGAVKYTDYALNQLLNQAHKRPWFDDTIFVIVADHCAGSAGRMALPIEKYHIPLFIYGPKYIDPIEIDTVASQIDIAPTLLALLNFSYTSFFFGQNILNPNFEARALIGNYQKLGLLKGNEMVILSPRKEIELVKTETENISVKKITASYPLVGDLMAFYQGADYILRHKLNRWQ